MLLRARYVFPVDGPPIADGVVQIDGPRLTAVGHDLGSADVTDLGNVAILPGLVNAHTHLEFSDLTHPLGEPGMAFADWIRAVLRYRARHETYEQSRQLGLAESLRHGTTILGEIASGVPFDYALDPPPDATLFQEIIAPRADRMESALAHCQIFFQSHEPVRYARGLSPHAPYTVHRDVFAAMIDWAAAHNEPIPIAFHLAETREELELLRTGRGPLHDLLVERGVWDDTAIRFGSRPLDYLRELSRAARALVIHGNYLDDEEHEFLAAHSDKMTVVYCPRTHAYFGHSSYPLQQMLARGIHVAVGTDSRASNPDLSVLEELRSIARHQPTVAPDLVLRLGTIHGAQALGQDDKVGSLAPGKLANLAVVRLPDHDARNPHELLFDSTAEVVATYYRGQLA